MSASETTIAEVADGIYQINTPVPPSDFPGGFSFNQYLIDGDAPTLFHTGLRATFEPVSAAIATVMPLSRLRYIGFSHFESDECGALNQFLAAAPDAEPLCGRVAAATSVGDFSDRPPRALADGEEIDIGGSGGGHVLRWFDTPHLPHAWECGFLMDMTTKTLFCGDLFTQPGHDHAPITESDIMGASEAMRGALDYFSHAVNTREMLDRLAAPAPTTLACMHGSAWRGDGAGLLRDLGRRIEATPPTLATQVMQG